MKCHGDYYWVGHEQYIMMMGESVWLMQIQNSIEWIMSL